MASIYNWIITNDYIENGLENGTMGPGPGYAQKAKQICYPDNMALFKMFDDDGKLYYAGKIWGDYDGFEPLDDFGMPSAGCTEIQLRGSDGIFRTV